MESREAGLAALDPKTAAPTRWNPDSDGDVAAIVPGPLGSPVYIGGTFASIGGKSRRGLAAVDGKTGAAPRWDPNVSGEVHTVVLSPTARYRLLRR